MRPLPHGARYREERAFGDLPKAEQLRGRVRPRSGGHSATRQTITPVSREPPRSRFGTSLAITSQARVHRLAFEGQNAERTLVHTAQRFPAHETLEPLDAERKLTERE